jgi:hypothetical protein
MKIFFHQSSLSKGWTMSTNTHGLLDEEASPISTLADTATPWDGSPQTNDIDSPGRYDKKVGSRLAPKYIWLARK